MVEYDDVNASKILESMKKSTNSKKEDEIVINEYFSWLNWYLKNLYL